jgi:hypothetical protein
MRNGPGGEIKTAHRALLLFATSDLVPWSIISSIQQISSLRGAKRRREIQLLGSASGLLRGVHHRAGHFGPDPLARNDEVKPSLISLRDIAS